MMRTSILLVCLVLAAGLAASQVQAQELRVNVLLKLIDEADVAALEQGPIAEIRVREGESSAAGAVLVRILSRDAELLCQRQQREYDVAAKRAENQVRIASAEASRTVAKTELKRAQEARERFGDAVSAAELDRLELAVTQASLAIEQAKHEQQVAELEAALKQSELELAQRRLERHDVQAPFDGVVAQIYRRRGEWVEPGEKVLRLVRTDRLKAEGFLAAEKASAAILGSRVTLTLAGSPATYAGTITFVSPESDPVNGQVRIVAEFDNAHKALRPGLKAALVIGAR